ncbi:MAG: hypothetical protein JW994_00755 [Candidatus Omnitrophica bacterium]|nr:hypothetical protein [Candidatus Omnitrophota bacterium]
MKHKVRLLLVLLLLMFILSACGETINGVTKDAKRVGKGIRTIFIRNGE